MKGLPHLLSYKYELKTIDSHTEGEPTRIVYDGFPELRGSTMMERKQDLMDRYDFLRKALMLEPRGHRDMFGAVLTPPVHPGADTGVIFLDSGGCLNMCGHGSIGCASMLVETGMVRVTEPVTYVTLDAPSGLIRVEVQVKDGHAVRASIYNVPAFLYREHLSVRTEQFGEVPFDISFGGSFFALVDADRIHLPLIIDNISTITDLGMTLRNEINRAFPVQHPVLPIHTVDLVEFYSKDCDANADMKNCVIFGDAQVDRSPCGTGTSAKLAAMYARGELKARQPFRYESITGSVFEGQVVGEQRVGPYTGVVPKITGSAHITGLNTWIVDDTDSLKDGFLLEKESGGPICADTVSA